MYESNHIAYACLLAPWYQRITSLYKRRSWKCLEGLSFCGVFTEFRHGRDSFGKHFQRMSNWKIQGKVRNTATYLISLEEKISHHKAKAEAGAATQHLLKKHLSFRWFPGAPEGSFFNEKEFHHLHMGENTRSWSVITRNIGQLKHGPKFWSPTQCCKRVEPILHGIIPLINLNPLKEWFPDSPLVAPANLPAI